MAISEAEKSQHKQRVGAVIFKGKRVISKGYNHSERCVRSITKEFCRWPWSIHAEVDSILKARCDLRGTSMLVVRINQKGELRLAMPCQHCLNYISYVSIRHLYFSTSENGVLEKSS